MEPKAFRTLLFLLHNPQRLISKEELLNTVWDSFQVLTGLSRALLLRLQVLPQRLVGDGFQPYGACRQLQRSRIVLRNLNLTHEPVSDRSHGGDIARLADVIAQPATQQRDAARQGALCYGSITLPALTSVNSRSRTSTSSKWKTKDLLGFIQ